MLLSLKMVILFLLVCHRLSSVGSLPAVLRQPRSDENDDDCDNIDDLKGGSIFGSISSRRDEVGSKEESAENSEMLRAVLEAVKGVRADQSEATRDMQKKSPQGFDPIGYYNPELSNQAVSAINVEDESEDEDSYDAYDDDDDDEEEL